MPLIDAATLVRRALECRYCVVQINTNGGTYDITRAIIEAAQEERAPVILGAYEANLQYRGYEYAAMQMRFFAERASVPVAVHLDHGGSPDACHKAIEAGFTSVMIDGSHLAIEQNIDLAKNVVAMAKPRGVSVEAEVGELQKLNPDGSVAEVKNLSDPVEVARMSECGIDMLAVGIGNAHGFYKDPPNIRFDMLEQYAKVSKVPLVLHGTTGLGDDVVARCVSMGMAKANLGTLIRTRCVEYTREVIAEGKHNNHPWRVGLAVKDRLKPLIAHILRTAGASRPRRGPRMSERRGGNLLVIQGGGPTAVLNTTLFGVVVEARSRYARVIGAKFGIEGLIRGELVDLSAIALAELERLKASPGAALGSTRVKASDADLDAIVKVVREHDVASLIVIGGNGSLRGAQVLAEAFAGAKLDCNVIGVPKTIDNDIVGTDRCPGFGSAARYVAQSVRDLGMDVRTLPQPVSLFETMGRSVGWLAGASALAKLDDDHAPHLIYLPEHPFEVERFLGDIDRVVTKHGWAVAVMNEGLRGADGRPVYETAATSQADALGRGLPGGVAAHLADVVTARLNIRCRWEKPGLCARASMLHVSPQDRADAELVGRAGVRAAIAGENAQMIALRPIGRDSGDAGPCESIPLARVAGRERPVPVEWLDTSDLAVTSRFVEYVRPLVGDLLDYVLPLKDRLPLLSAPRGNRKL